MKSPRKLSNELRERVRQRAQYLCEYCHTNELWQYVPFTIDHVLPIAEGGENTQENLALALLALNRERIVQIRRADIEVGRHPPTTDFVQL